MPSGLSISNHPLLGNFSFIKNYNLSRSDCTFKDSWKDWSNIRDSFGVYLLVRVLAIKFCISLR